MPQVHQKRFFLVSHVRPLPLATQPRALTVLHTSCFPGHVLILFHLQLPSTCPSSLLVGPTTCSTGQVPIQVCPKLHNYVLRGGQTAKAFSPFYNNIRYGQKERYYSLRGIVNNLATRFFYVSQADRQQYISIFPTHTKISCLPW